MKNTINILHDMRIRIDERINHNKVVSYFLLGLLIIQFIFFSLIRKFDMFGTLGTIITFAWCIFAVYNLFRLKQEQDNIDEFYLLNLSGGKDGKRKK